MSGAAASALIERSLQMDRALVSTFLESIPHHVFFKDRSSRFIAVSRSLMIDFDCTSPDQVVGRTDFDFFSPVHARRAYDDEQQIIRTGVAIRDKLERETWPNGEVTWALTSKLPLRDEDRNIIGTFGLSRDVTEERNVEMALEAAQKELVEASRVAGMAEVATGVLHNVGNVLNSLNVSASVITTALRQSKADSLAKLAAMLREHQGDLVDFLTNDAKGKRVPEFLASLARHAAEEHGRMLREISALQNNVDHIKEIVSMQQAYATMVGVVEPLEPAALMEDALRMNVGALLRHEVQVERDFQTVPVILAEKAKVIQILVNLIRNAKFACDETGLPEKRITLRIQTGPTPDRVQLIVSDNGVGIPAENLTRIFGHGFTTRSHGHGFGLHSAANAAREMKGSLTVHSDGRGTGATFTLELPIAQPAIAAA
jgi:PAS domain S-box-containing protein